VSSKALQLAYLNAICPGWEPEYRFHPKRKFKLDYGNPKRKLAVEIEGGVWTGGRHIHPSGFLKDVEKYNILASMGWLLFRCTPSDFFNIGEYLSEVI
jgi:very-short-patch-repair endonuclease